MRVFISLSDSADRFPVNHNEEWYSPVKVNQKPLGTKRRGVKKSKRKIPKNEGTETDLQPSFGMVPRCP